MAALACVSSNVLSLLPLFCRIDRCGACSGDQPSESRITRESSPPGKGELRQLPDKNSHVTSTLNPLDFKRLFEVIFVQHSVTDILQYKTYTMELPKDFKSNELWDHFKELEDLLTKCRLCGEKIRSFNSQIVTKELKAHLKIKHKILDINPSIPYNLRHYYTNLPNCKAECNQCGTIISNREHWNLTSHLNRKHSGFVINQSQHENVWSTPESTVFLQDFEFVACEQLNETLPPLEELQASPEQVKIQEDTVNEYVPSNSESTVPLADVDPLILDPLN
ncbi:uncharacterized protein LOC143905858 [Temnothorax americanus]|uniref:uncharacterized protein LOC143905858 n=1 Tax=Temnothorax americanus TaxID=1964332 RepID=UPI00406980A5